MISIQKIPENFNLDSRTDLSIPKRTRARVIPVAIEGMQRVLPIGKMIPRIGKRICITYGKPIDLSDLFEREPTRETAQLVVDRVMELIRRQHRS